MAATFASFQTYFRVVQDNFDRVVLTELLGYGRDLDNTISEGVPELTAHRDLLL